MTLKTIAPLPAMALMLSALVMPSSAAMAQAGTKTTTTTEQAAYPNGKTINLSNFDLNKNGILSSVEVAEMLFKLFDTDTSGAIESGEYEFKSVLTVAPMEKTTQITYDYDNDGVADKTQYKFENFAQNTLLARFDVNKDGLSPHEFVDQYLANIDSNGNHSIDLAEWRTAYMVRILPAPLE